MIPKEARNYIETRLRKGRVICLTGAGISSESGIPTFRGKDGLWQRYKPEIYGTAEGLISVLKTQPKNMVNYLVDLYSFLLKARPNPAHLALSVLEKEGILNAIITQNIDNLHQAAGSREVIELHGNAFRIRCMRCNKTITLEKDRISEMLRLLKVSQDSRIKLLKIFSRYFPRCTCGFRYRIDIVFFGEILPQDELSRAYAELSNCNTLLVIGTSLAVFPAAELPLYAKERGAKLIEINDVPTALSHSCDYKIIGSAGKVLTEVLSILKN